MPAPVQTSDLPPGTKVLVDLLSDSLREQVAASNKTSERVDALSEKIDAMGERIASEVSRTMRWQTKVIGSLVALAIVLLGGAAGVNFVGETGTISFSTEGFNSTADVSDDRAQDPPVAGLEDSDAISESVDPIPDEIDLTDPDLDSHPEPLEID